MHLVGLARDDEEQRRHHVVRLDQLGGLAGGRPFPHFLGHARRVGAGAGIDDVHRHAGAHELLGPDLRGHFQRRLGRAIGHAALAVHGVELGGDVDDPTPAARHQDRGDAARQLIGHHVVGVHGVLDDLVGELPEFPRAFHEAFGIGVGEGEAGVVDQNVEPAKTLLCGGHHLVAGGGLAQVERQAVQGAGVIAGVALQCRHVFGDMADRHHLASGAQQAERHGPAQAAQAAGDDGNFSVGCGGAHCLAGPIG